MTFANPNHCENVGLDELLLCFYHIHPLSRINLQ